MDAQLLRCIFFLLLLGLISGLSPRDQLLYVSSEAFTMTTHDTDDVPNLNPSPTTGPPTMPTIIPPTTPTLTPMPLSGGGFGGEGDGGGGGGGGGGSWCVANPSASEKALQVGLDYACGYGGADCSQIQPGAGCYNPNTVRDHASFAYNAYYQKNPDSTSCDFGGTAQLSSTDPSSGSCHFPSKGAASPPPTTPPTPATPPPTMQTPPIMQTPPMDQTPPAMSSPPSPPNMFMPGTPFGGASGFEPTGSPNKASTPSEQLLIYLSSTSILMYILLASSV